MSNRRYSILAGERTGRSLVLRRIPSHLEALLENQNVDVVILTSSSKRCIIRNEILRRNHAYYVLTARKKELLDGGVSVNIYYTTRRYCHYRINNDPFVVNICIYLCVVCVSLLIVGVFYILRKEFRDRARFLSKE